ncbi:MAG: glycosidase, partial [Candidatus Kryptoniota bacterium]
MSIHLARSKEIDGEWENLGLFMKAEPDAIFKKSWIGAGAPPIGIGLNQYLMLYHTGHYKHGGEKEYDIGVCKLKYDGKFKISDRNDRLLVPSTRYERSGDPELGVNNTVFVCGAYRIEDEIFFPYAGSDSVILSAKLRFEQQ